VIRLTFLIFILFFLSNCSFSEKSRIWNDKEEKVENQNIKKLFAKEEKKITEFNPDLKLDLSKIKFNNSTLDNQNNFGAQIYENLNKKIFPISFLKLKILVI
jgi:outer membrane protein assembly factor BamB